MAGDAQPAVIHVRAGALFGPKQLVADGLVDNAGDEFAFSLERDRYGEVRNAVQEVGRSVERIDDPTIVGIVTCDRTALFEQEPVAGPRRGEGGVQDVLGAVIGRRDEIGGSLFRDLKLFHFAEVADQAARRLAGGARHHVDQG